MLLVSKRMNDGLQRLGQLFALEKPDVQLRMYTGESFTVVGSLRFRVLVNH